MWNDTDLPIAYLITFRSYGTWLHGDQRGSVDRFSNQYNSPYLPPDWNRREKELKRMKGKSIFLDARQRRSVEKAIRETCAIRHWILRAINVRTNHVHVVVSIGIAKPERALNDFKAYATRSLRRDRRWFSEGSPWADKGSKRYLWTQRSVELAIDYVMNGQGEDLHRFDEPPRAAR